jgi:predicted nucleic acid-binding protein
MWVMLDTNVLVSAFIFPNDRMNALMYKAALQNRLVLSSYVIAELLAVVGRKFPAKAKHVDLFLERLPFELVYTPTEQDGGLFKVRDSGDYPVLYSAVTEGVDLFVTGDSDFDDVEVEKPEIVTPSEFLERY